MTGATSRTRPPRTAVPGPDPLAALERRLGVAFSDRGLLLQALTHRSLETPGYERLEFLGDSLLGFLVAEALFARFPALREGELTRLRALLVRRETLAEVARDLDLGCTLRLGEGERKSGGHERDSILADAFEAVVGAVYRDHGMEAARGLVMRLFGDRLDSIEPGRVIKDAKTRLQEIQQKYQRPLPEYRLIEAAGPDHEQSFVVHCVVETATGSRSYEGRGRSRRIAEQEAATAACLDLCDRD